MTLLLLLCVCKVQAYRREALEELQQLQKSIDHQKEDFQETKSKVRQLCLGSECARARLV